MHFFNDTLVATLQLVAEIGKKIVIEDKADYDELEELIKYLRKIIQLYQDILSE